MIPVEIFYMTSLAVYAFFIYFAFFVYRRTRKQASGRAMSFALLALACYVAPSALGYDADTRAYHSIIFAIGWLGATLSVVLLMQTAVLLEREEFGTSHKSHVTLWQMIMILIGYGGAIAFGVLGSGIWDPSGGAIFRFEDTAAAVWPNCLWRHFSTPTGPYYPTFGLYVLSAILMVLIQLGRLAVRAHKAAASEDAATEEVAIRLAARNRYFWLSVGIFILAFSGEILVFIVGGNLETPESAGQGLLALGALIVGITIARPETASMRKDFDRDFYRSASTVALLCASAIAVGYWGESGNVNKLTLLALITLTIIFFVNIDQWLKLVDNLFLGPQVAEERARIRSILEDTQLEPDLLKAKLAFEGWSPETQKVFLQLGEGVSRSTIAGTEFMHISTVDLHIRRIKDSLKTNKLEEIRALGHRLSLHMRLSGDAS